MHNLFFFPFLLCRALSRASPHLEAYPYAAGLSSAEDNKTTALVRRLLDSSILHSCEPVFTAFDEGLLFREKQVYIVHGILQLYTYVFDRYTAPIRRSRQLSGPSSNTVHNTKGTPPSTKAFCLAKSRYVFSMPYIIHIYIYIWHILLDSSILRSFEPVFTAFDEGLLFREMQVYIPHAIT